MTARIEFVFPCMILMRAQGVDTKSHTHLNLQSPHIEVWILFRSHSGAPCGPSGGRHRRSVPDKATGKLPSLYHGADGGRGFVILEAGAFNVYTITLHWLHYRAPLVL